MRGAVTMSMNRTVRSGLIALLLVVIVAPLYCAGQTAGKVTFVNSCSYSLTLLNNGQQLAKLDPKGQITKDISSFVQGNANVIIVYPNLPTAQCPDCDKWTDLGGVPGTVQRAAWMWEGNDAVYAAYCNPNLSGRGICAVQHNCCGVGMVQDGTFGTHWEFTPNGGGSNDFVNLSTNAGSGPHSPPNLCPKGGPNDCVSAAANIFYNVPIAWSTNQTCNFTTQGKKVTGSTCASVDCPDAYQHPTDDKQAACTSNNPNRGYLVTYCPAGSSMPSPK